MHRDIATINNAEGPNGAQDSVVEHTETLKEETRHGQRPSRDYAEVAQRGHGKASPARQYPSYQMIANPVMAAAGGAT